MNNLLKPALLKAHRGINRLVAENPVYSKT